MTQKICKTALRTLLILALVFVYFFTYAQSSTFQLDVKQSKLFWKGTKTIGSKHYGFLLFSSGWLRTNVAGAPDEGIFTINMNSVTSTEHEKEAANQKVAAELKGSAFFEVAKYPSTRIVVKRILSTAVQHQFRVEGDLTIKSTTHPIVFFATIKQGGNTLTAAANLTIDRVKWGIHQEKPTSVADQFFSGIKDKMIEDEIPIALKLVFIKK